MQESSTPAIIQIQTRCCIVGGGPAGMMLGFLLARAGVETVVLEKHADFLRDFRGDTVHPSTLQLLHELGILVDFLQRPHQEVRQLTGYVGPSEVRVADFTHLPTRCKFVALMPQWDFLNFIEEHARRYPTFGLRMQTEAIGLLEEAGYVTGVRAQTPDGPLEVRADLVVGTDGRHSTVRKSGRLQVEEIGAPIDVLWMRLSRQEGDPRQPLGRFNRGKILVMIDRDEYWQCAYVIPKGDYDGIRERGLENFRANIAEIAPFLRDRLGELPDWNDIRLLTVKIDRLRRWYRKGLLCIGDAAHAMSPIGGVGINLAVQDAVAAANILAHPLRDGSVRTSDLARVQQRREFPTRATQRAQVFVQNRVISRALATRQTISLPWPLRLLRSFPFLGRIPARLVGIGVRPEHVRTPNVFRGSK